MEDVIIISNNKEYQDILDKEGIVSNLFDYFSDEIASKHPFVFVVDDNTDDSNGIVKKISALNANRDFVVIYLSNALNAEDSLESFVRVLLKPFSNKIFAHTVNSAVESAKALYNLRNENSELKKNLYQIDTFYNASSKFAGTLDKEKLYEVLFETLERVLSFDMAAFLIRDDFEEEKLKFYINSLKKTTEELNQTLIKRLSLSAREEGITAFKNGFAIDIIQTVKPSYKNEYFTPDIINSDTLFAPIIIKEKFEGVIEIFRKNPFTKEDVTCFQSVVHQMLAPLRSAILYEDIKNANSKLKKLERMKSEFVSIVSHELRTPLTPINNALSIIQSEEAGKIGENNKNFVNIAKRNVSRLSGIIEDLLDLSRMQTGKFDFKFKKANISSSLELIYNTFKNQAQSKDIEFELSYEENLNDVYIDSHRMDQVLSNLITNALKFTPNGGKITISAVSTTADEINKAKLITPVVSVFGGDYLKITVKDTGVGIEEEDIIKIFDKFSQIENSLTRNTGGIGLGLAITKYFIDAHLGGIWVESKKNEGSAFNVVIPFYSEKKAFEADLNLKIKNDSDTAYIKIEENENSNFYENLKSSNIIKMTQDSGEFIHKEDNRTVSELFMVNLDKNAYEFMISKIEEEIKSAGENCDIVLTKAYYKKESLK